MTALAGFVASIIHSARKIKKEENKK